MQPLTIAEIRERLEQAMGVANDPHWLEEAERKLEAARFRGAMRRVYDVSTVGARIRTAREVVGLSQAQLASRMGVPKWRVGLWERGKANIDAAQLLRLARSLAVHPKWLLLEQDDGGPPLPDGLLRRQHRANWQQADRRARLRARAKAEVERLRGLRGPARPRSGNPVTQKISDPEDQCPEPSVS